MIEKRAFKRTPVNIKANIVYDNDMCSGTVTNVSESGVYIETGSYIPFKLKYKLRFKIKPKFVIFIDSNGSSIKIHVKTRRWFVIDRNYHGIGVEVLNPSQYYFNLVRKHKFM